MNTKAGIKPIPNIFCVITAGELVEYLENEILGFRVETDFTRWTGYTPEYSYVRMRVVMQAEDVILANANNSDDYAMRELNKYDAAIPLDDSILKVIQPFMYPSDFDPRLMNPDAIRHLNEIGVIGSKMDEIVKFSKLNLVTDPHSGKRYYLVYLRPEKIINDMLSNPDTGKPDGEVFLRRVYGERSSEFKWLVEVAVKNNKLISGEVDINKLFSMKK